MSSVVETRTVAPAVKPKVSYKDEVPADLNIPDNYVSWTLRNQKALPPVTWGTLLQNIQWLSLAILTTVPAVSVYGMCTVKLRWETAVWSAVYYLITGLGEYP